MPADLRDHAVRLRNRRGRHCLRRSCDGQDKASSSNQPDHFSFSLLAVGTSRLVPKLRGCRTSAGVRLSSSNLSASGPDGSPPCGRRDSPGGKCCHSHKQDRCSQHSRKKDSRSLHSLRMDSIRDYRKILGRGSACCRNTKSAGDQIKRTAAASTAELFRDPLFLADLCR